VVALAAVLALLVWQGYPYASAWLSEIPINEKTTPTQRAVNTLLPTTTRVPTLTSSSMVPTPDETGEQGTTITESSTPTQAPTLTPTPTQAPSFTPSPSPTATEPVYTGIFLELSFNDVSWIQVAVDGIRQFQGELEVGTYRSWYGEERVELRVGNAGAVDVTVNGQKIGPLGEVGEVVDRIFEIVDDQVTEATPTPAPTLSVPELTATDLAPSPVPTIAPTLTVTPAATIAATSSP
jgi:hypothetical protein